MSKIIELIRPEQAVKGFDKKNLSKSTLEALNRIEREYVVYKYRDMVTFQDSASLSVAGFGNFMSKNERFIIPEIFPAKAETDKIGFQRFALPMIRNINLAETQSIFFNPQYQEVKYEMEVLSTRNYVAYEFYPYDIPLLQSVNDTNLSGVLIAIDVGAATKVRFWRTGGKLINYILPSYSLNINFHIHENPYPLFEYDVVPYTRNYIYLFVGTTVSDYYNYHPIYTPPQFIDQVPNVGADVYSPKIKMELFSEDYSAQRFESGITAGNVQVINQLNNPIFNVSNELCVVFKLNGNFTGDGNAPIFIFEPFYSESNIPNTLIFKTKNIQEPFSSLTMNKIKLPIKATSFSTGLNINGLYYTIEPR